MKLEPFINRSALLACYTEKKSFTKSQALLLHQLKVVALLVLAMLVLVLALGLGLGLTSLLLLLELAFARLALAELTLEASSETISLVSAEI